MGWVVVARFHQSRVSLGHRRYIVCADHGCSSSSRDLDVENLAHHCSHTGRRPHYVAVGLTCPSLNVVGRRHCRGDPLHRRHHHMSFCCADFAASGRPNDCDHFLGGILQCELFVRSKCLIFACRSLRRLWCHCPAHPSPCRCSVRLYPCRTLQEFSRTSCLGPCQRRRGRCEGSAFPLPVKNDKVRSLLDSIISA